MPPAAHEAASLASILIQKCSSTTTVRKARQLHALILTSIPTVLQSLFLHNNILSMFARCGSLADSRLVFDKMPHRNIVSFNALIAASSRSSQHASLTLKLFAQLEDDGLRPNGSTFTSLLQASSLLEDCLMGSLLHTQLIKLGFWGDTCVQTSLLGMYSNCGDLASAKEVFTSIGDKDDVAWNSIIFGCMKNDDIAEGFHLYDKMVRSGTIPTQFTYSMILNACSRQKDHDFGQLVHTQVIISGTPTDLPLHNSLLDMYCSCGGIHSAIQVFSRIEYPDLVSWNSMIAGYSESGHGEKAMEMFVQLQQTTFAKADEYTFAAIISATGAFLASDYGKPLYAQVIKRGYEKSVYVGSTLVSMYFNNGDTDSAQKIFSSIAEKDVILWTEMITGHCRMADGENAIKFFHGMSQEGLRIDSLALSSALSACADLVTLKQGQMIHCQASKTGYDVEIAVCGSLIDMYAKTGDLQAAELIISDVGSPDLKCWNAILSGYSHHGKAKEALKVFDEILEHNLRPDQVTFISLLAACSHCGLVDEGIILWDFMIQSGFRPVAKHYSCMVSLLSRAGLLEEAEKMILESPFSGYNLDLWRTLLSSCISNKKLELGVRAGEQVLSIDADDSATHVLLANLYAAAGKWDWVKRMRRKIRGQMLEKDPGLSWVEVLNDICVFSSGDQSHPKIDEMRAELQRLLGNMRRLDTDFHR
ncbi:Pentatricopeptide repeat-containing protein [Actinidia chinensis var. chinensis]|uniref:Pentatricopeptide repeat-containing protein n=1 Tax=Actinidia chinensis var. chinensis TaxID=1590841 RepID=A0A2R6QT65_ACTCC|nr:Pentatricopeptide repeat-containing protein [Actinidia chinensis var. chinensis]